MITKKQLVGKKFNISKFISEQDEEDFDTENETNGEEGDTNVGDFVDMVFHEKMKDKLKDTLKGGK